MAYALSRVLVPLLLAFLVAYILDPFVDFFEKRKVPRLATIACVGLLACLIFMSVPIIVVPNVVHQADAIIHSGKTDAGGLNRWLVDTLNRPEAVQFLQEIGWVKEGERDVNTLDIVRQKVGEYLRTQAVQFVRAHATVIAAAGETAGATLYDLFSTISNRLVRIILFIGDFVLFAVVAGFMLRDFDSITSGARSLIPRRYEAKTVEVISKIDLQLRSFLRGQLTVGLCLGTLYIIGFLISGLQALAVVIGGMAVLVCFIPYLGVTFVGITAVIMTILQYGLDWHVLSVLITIAVVQTLEANFLTPKIIGDQVGLSPVWVILAIVTFGNLLGFLGVLIAVPSAAALKVLVVEAVAYYKRSPVFDGGGPA